MSQFNLMEQAGPLTPASFRHAAAPEYRPQVDPTSQQMPLGQFVNSSGARMAEELQQSLRLVGQVIGQTGRLVAGAREDEIQAAREADRIEERRIRENDRLIAKDEQAQRQKLTLERGMAAQLVREALPKIRNDFETNKLGVPLQDEDVPKLTDELVRQYSTSLEPGVADAFRDYLQPRVDELFYAYRRQNVDEAAKITVSMAKDAIAAETDPTRMRDILAGVRSSGLPIKDDEVDAVLLSGMRAAATEGGIAGRKKFDVIKQMLGTRFEQQQDVYAYQLDRTDAARQSQRDQDFRNAIAKMHNDGAELPEIEAAIQTARASGSVQENVAQVELNQIATMKRQVEGELRKARLEDSKTLARSNLIEDVRNQMRMVTVTGGAAFIPDKLFIVDSEGEKHSVSRDDVIQEATAAELDNIARQTSAGDSPLPNQIRFLASNGTVYQPWKRALEAGAMVSSFDVDRDTVKELPAPLRAGYELAKTMRAVNPRVLNAHVDQQTGRFYEVAELAEKYVTKDPSAALLTAMKAAKTEAFSDNAFNRVKSDALKSAVAEFRDGAGYLWWKQAGAKNYADVETEIARTADMYVKTLGISATDAVKEAGERVKGQFAIVNGWAVDTYGMRTPTVLKDAGPLAIQKYIGKHPDEQLNPSTLTFQSFDVGRSWVLFNRETLEPVRHFINDGRFTESDFADLAEDRDRPIREREAAAQQRSEISDAAMRKRTIDATLAAQPDKKYGYISRDQRFRAGLRDQVSGRPISADLPRQ